MLADRIGTSDKPDQEERLKTVQLISDVDAYSMPAFPSPLDQDPDIWGLTAVMADRLLYYTFRKEGYKKHTFIPELKDLVGGL